MANGRWRRISLGSGDTYPVMKFLTVVDWLLWSTLFIALTYALIAILTERNRSSPSGPGLGVFLILLGLLFSAATGASLHWFAQKQSITGMTLMSLVLAWPLMPIVARPLVLAYKNGKCVREKIAQRNFSVS